jgi:hypothetical protein
VTAAQATERWPNLTIKKIPKMVLQKLRVGARRLQPERREPAHGAEESGRAARAGRFVWRGCGMTIRTAATIRKFRIVALQALWRMKRLMAQGQHLPVVWNKKEQA